MVDFTQILDKPDDEISEWAREKWSVLIEKEWWSDSEARDYVSLFARSMQPYAPDLFPAPTGAQVRGPMKVVTATPRPVTGYEQQQGRADTPPGGKRSRPPANTIPQFETVRDDPVEAVHDRLQQRLSAADRAGLSQWFATPNPRHILRAIDAPARALVTDELDSSSDSLEGLGRPSAEFPRLRGVFPGIDPDTMLLLVGASLRIIETAALAAGALHVLSNEGRVPTLQAPLSVQELDAALQSMPLEAAMRDDRAVEIVWALTDPDTVHFVEVARSAGLLGWSRKRTRVLYDIGGFYAFAGVALFHASLVERAARMHGPDSLDDLDGGALDEAHLERSIVRPGTQFISEEILAPASDCDGEEVPAGPDECADVGKRSPEGFEGGGGTSERSLWIYSGPPSGGIPGDCSPAAYKAFLDLINERRRGTPEDVEDTRSRILSNFKRAANVEPLRVTLAYLRQATFRSTFERTTRLTDAEVTYLNFLIDEIETVLEPPERTSTYRRPSQLNYLVPPSPGRIYPGHGRRRR